MSWSVAFLLLAGVSANDKGKTEYFENYTQAYLAAEQAKLPMLVILNPSREAGEKPISLDDIRTDEQSRKLLEKYIVAVIDTGTSHGKTMHKLFGSEKLPRVVVIDKTQTLQIYQSSEPHDGKQWTEVLEAFQSGQKSASLDVDQECPT